jgi:hypothetical protein
LSALLVTPRNSAISTRRSIDPGAIAGHHHPSKDAAILQSLMNAGTTDRVEFMG